MRKPKPTAEDWRVARNTIASLEGANRKLALAHAVEIAGRTGIGAGNASGIVEAAKKFEAFLNGKAARK